MSNRMPRLKPILAVVALAAVIAACRSEYPVRPEVEPWITTESGLAYYDIEVGKGRTVASTDTVIVHYEGWLEDGTKFDSSRDRGDPVRFTLDRVIDGFAEGVTGMRVGGIRKLNIPPDLAYGDRGVGPIPPNARVLFEVEVLEARPVAEPPLR